MDLKVPRKLVDVTKISISTENRISNSVYCQNSSWPIRRLRKGLTTFDRRNKACVFRQLFFFEFVISIIYSETRIIARDSHSNRLESEDPEYTDCVH